MRPRISPGFLFRDDEEYSIGSAAKWWARQTVRVTTRGLRILYYVPSPTPPNRASSPMRLPYSYLEDSWLWPRTFHASCLMYKWAILGFQSNASIRDVLVTGTS
jgi:hypothetical protein